MRWKVSDHLLGEINKSNLIDELRERLSAQIDALTHSQRSTQAGATHEETRAEDPKDTRATEAAYLARGLAGRVEQLKLDYDRLSTVMPLDVGDSDAVEVGRLVRLVDDDDQAVVYFLLPVAGGELIQSGSIVVRVLSPASPVSQQMLGRSVGEDFTVNLPKGEVTFSIEEVI